MNDETTTQERMKDLKEEAKQPGVNTTKPETPLTKREKLIIRILLFVASIIADKDTDYSVRSELNNLTNHISCWH